MIIMSEDSTSTYEKTESLEDVGAESLPP